MRRRLEKENEVEETGVPNDDPSAGEDQGSAMVEEASPTPARGLEAIQEPPSSPEDQLEALRAEHEILQNTLLHRRADFENYRRRVERDRSTASQETLAGIFEELLGTVDNLERALSAGGGETEFREGVELTHRELIGLFESHGVVAVDPVGQRFDPATQQALIHEPVQGLGDGEVAEVFRKGYSFGERLLRPALVKVAKGEEPEDGNGGG